MAKQKKKTKKRQKKTHCEKRGCELKFDKHGLMPHFKKDRKFCGCCTICHKGDHFPFASMPGGANCHAECYKERYGEIDNARAITSLVRGNY